MLLASYDSLSDHFWQLAAGYLIAYMAMAASYWHFLHVFGPIPQRPPEGLSDGTWLWMQCIFNENMADIHAYVSHSVRN